jgi:tetratricopeptide (TPR) repeat protein
MLEWGRTRLGASDAGFVLGALFYQGRSHGNRGRLSDATDKVEEGLRLAELLGDRFWLPRVANTRGWILSELCDTENALRVNTEAVRLAQDIGDIEAECMARINAARDCLTLGDPHTAWDHLQQATIRCEQDRWFRWVYFPRLQAEAASYWIARGDLPQALACAQCSLEDAERTTSRKRMAWAHGLLGEIAVQQERMDDARHEFDAALQILAEHACPTIEWRILRRAALAAAIAGDTAGRAAFIARAGAVVRSLADGIRSAAARTRFLQSEAVRELVT